MEEDTQPGSKDWNELYLQYYNASQKAIWLTGTGISSKNKMVAPVLKFMIANQIKLPFIQNEVLRYLNRCKNFTKYNDGTLSYVCEIIENVFKYYTVDDILIYNPYSDGSFSGLVIPQILTQFYLEENESQIDNETSKICQIKAELNFQVGESIELRMFTDVLPEGVFLIKKKHTVFHGYGVMKKYRIAAMNQEEEEYPE